MSSSRIERKLAAIMFTDIAGYTALSAKDENKALALLDKQEQILTPIIEEFNGTLHNRVGDGLLFTFPTVTDAVKCGIKIQEETKAINDLNLRIGIHEGEITLKDGDALGDDVNIASRIEAFSPIGGVAISSKVQQNISSLPEFETKYISTPKLKGVSQEIKIYCITSHGITSPRNNLFSSMIKRRKFSFVKHILFPLTGIIITLIGAGFWFIYPLLSLASAVDDNIYDTSLAVLYFDTIDDSENDFFSDGLTEEIISRLSRINNLKVTPRTDVKKYKSKDLSLNDISNELKVDFILEGMVRKDNNRIRVNVSLVSNKDNTIIWNNTFNEQDTLIFIIQDQIAENIANNLDIKIAGNDMQNCLKRPTTSYKAYENMSKVRSNMMSLDMFNFLYATTENYSQDYFDLLEESIQKDPYYAEPYAYLSLFTLINALRISFDSGSESESDSLLYVASSYSEQSIELDHKNELALSLNIIIPMIEKILTCNTEEEFSPSPIEVRELIKKTNILLSDYPNSPLANLLQGGVYFAKSNVPIINEENDINLFEESLLKSFNRSKEILYYSPNDAITYYTFYLSTVFLTKFYLSDNKLFDASYIAEEFLDFNEENNLLSSLFP